MSADSEPGTVTNPGDTKAYLPTNAASSGVYLDKKAVRALARRSDGPGLWWLGQWAVMLGLSGGALWWSLGSWWVVPAMLVYGTVLTVPTYALSHECSHGTAFRSRWLNETCLWISSLIFFEEPSHRRYSHTRHHTCTWHVGRDTQMPFDTPMGFKGWLLEISGVGLTIFECRVFWRNALGRFADATLEFTPASELPKLKWGARACIAVYAVLAALIVAGQSGLLLFVVIPRIVGGPVMMLFTLLQHVELQENSPSILESTRSFRSNWLGRFLYMNMNHHIEHHLYPQVPFHALPELQQAVAEQVPAPDAGFFRSNGEALLVVVRRSLGLSTKAPNLRQAPHMITDGGDYAPVSKASM